MAKKRRKGGKRRQKIPIAATAGMLIGLKNLWDSYQQGGTHRAMVSLTGYDSNYGFKWQWATSTIPMVAGAAVSMVAAKSGINRYIKVPFVKI